MFSFRATSRIALLVSVVGAIVAVAMGKGVLVGEGVEVGGSVTVAVGSAVAVAVGAGSGAAVGVGAHAARRRKMQMSANTSTGFIAVLFMPYPSSVNITPVPNVQHSYTLLLVINFVNDAIIANTNAPAIASRQLSASLRTRVLTKRIDRIAHSLVRFVRQLFQFLLSAAQDEDSVGHLRLRSISEMACSKGIALSRDFFAAS